MITIKKLKTKGEGVKVMRNRKISFVLFVVSVMAASFLYGRTANAAEDLALKVRVSEDKLPEARAMKNPESMNNKSVEEGKQLYVGGGTCFNCHGEKGKGDGEGGASFDPKPRDFTNVQWQKARTDGEIYWAITNGTAFGMIPFGDMLSETERWQLVSYIRQLGNSQAATTNFSAK